MTRRAMGLCLLAASLAAAPVQASAETPKVMSQPTTGGYLVPVAVGVLAGALIWPMLAPALGIGAFGAAAAPAAPGAAAAAAVPAAAEAAGGWGLPSFLTGTMAVGGVIGGTMAYLGVR